MLTPNANNNYKYMTPILKVITEYCAVYVDDINLSDLASANPPLYAWRMWSIFRPAISLFSCPPTMPQYLLGTTANPTFTEPKFDTYKYVADEDLTADTQIDLGADFIGYELSNCQLQLTDDFGNIILQPTSVANYDSLTGIVTLSASTDNPIPKGTVFDMDFYTDGAFAKDLSSEIMNILGMCFQCIWQDRFNTDWLSMVAKIEDRSFTEQNRANKVRADSERLIVLRTKLAEEMRRFEQNLAYRKIVPHAEDLI